MAGSGLRVVLAENRLTEAGITLRSLCAEVRRQLELILVGRRSDLVHALPAHCPEVALIDLSLLQPDAPARILLLQDANPSIPLSLVADSADKDCAVSCLWTGAKHFMLEGFIDERTMARGLNSALGEQIGVATLEGHTGRTSLEFGEMHYAFTAQLDNLETLQLRAGHEAVGHLLAEVAEVRQKTVPSSDLVIPSVRGKFVLYIRHADFLSARALSSGRKSGLPGTSLRSPSETCRCW